MDPILPIEIIDLTAPACEPLALASIEANPQASLLEQFVLLKSSSHTQQAYRRQLQRFLQWNSHKPWQEVTPDDIRKYYRDLKAQDFSQASIKQALSSLRSFYRWLRKTSHYPATQALPTDFL